MRTSPLLTVLLFSSLACAQDVHVRVDPSAPPAAPGNEDRTVFPTIQNAMDHHPWPGPGGRVYIEIAPGTYHERVIITQNHTNITLIGTGKSPEDVVITNSLNAKTAGGTFFTETVEINGTGFEADNLTFENAAGNTGQAVAVADRADRSIFKHCRFLGHQDTLFADYGRQYYVDSYIEGGVDFIFGNAAAVFDHTELHANGPGYLTAQSRTAPDQTTGYVILTAASPAASTSMPHPWTPPPPEQRAPPQRTTASASAVPGAHTPASSTSTPNSPPILTPPAGTTGTIPPTKRPPTTPNPIHTGPGANPAMRVPWSHQLTPAEAKPFYPATFLAALTTGTPKPKLRNYPDIKHERIPEKIASRELPQHPSLQARPAHIGLPSRRAGWKQPPPAQSIVALRL